MPLEVTAHFHWDAAHRLDRLPATHKCHRPHGHTYQMWVTCRGMVDQDNGMVIDYADIKSVVEPIIFQKYDHYDLNVTLPYITTAENIAVWFYVELKGKLAGLYSIRLREGMFNEVYYCP